MPFNPSGVFTRLYRWVTDRDNDIKIDATRMDAEMDGMVAGLNSVVNQSQPFTGNVKAPAGTALTPAFSFSNDPDSGVYRAGADAVGIATGGQNRATFNAAGATIAGATLATPKTLEIGRAGGAIEAVIEMHGRSLSSSSAYSARIRAEGGSATVSGQGLLQLEAAQVAGASGSASSPGWCFHGDLGTGLYSPSYGALGLSTQGGSRLHINSVRANFSVPVNAPPGDLAAPGLQFSNANNGIYWSIGAGPTFTASGAVIGELTAGTALPAVTSIVTRQAGDARYMRENEAGVVRTTGAQTIAGAKTFTGNTTFDSTQQGVYFDFPAATTNAMHFRRSGALQATIGLLADNTFRIAPLGTNRLQILAATELSMGDGPVYLENHASDGDGTGLCVRASTNPSGDGMIFSVRSSGGALGLGVQQSKISSGRAEMYLGANDVGAGGNRVSHAGVAAGSVTDVCFASYSGGSTVPLGGTTSGSNLRPSCDGGVSATSLTGTWSCRGHGLSGWSTEWKRIL